MCEFTSAHAGSEERGGEVSVGSGVCDGREPMARTNHECDPVESPATDTRYSGFGTEDGYIVYDTEETAAWIESDTAISLAEMM